MILEGVFLSCEKEIIIWVKIKQGRTPNEKVISVTEKEMYRS